MKLSKTEIDALIAASPRTFVAFNKLILSQAHQARSHGSTPKMTIAELAASIKECGVLQNLIVVQGAQGRHEVCAGGRRLEALTLLAGNGDIAENHPVPVLIVPADKALIASLSENCFHIPMHPADEYIAFSKLIEQGKSVEDVAAAFGVTPLVVKRRMKLASVSPKLMKLFREEEIGLDCLMALASVDDQQKQEETWAALPSWNRRPDYLRQLLAQGEIESDRDPVAKYVTLKAYEKAGGALRRDLFCDDDKKAYLLDAALLEKLAVGKLQRQAKQLLAEGWKWVDVRARYVFDEYVKYGTLRKTKRQPNEQESAAMEALDNRIAVLQEQMEQLADEDGDEETYYQLEGEAEKLAEQREALEEALSVWPAELMARAGCVVHVGNNGATAVKYGLIRPEDRDDMVQIVKQTAEEGGEGEGTVSLPSKTRPTHSEKLMRCLTAHRVAAVQAELVDRPDIALATLTAHLAQKILRDNVHTYQYDNKVLAISITDNRIKLQSAAPDVETSAAWAKLEDQHAAWDKQLPQNKEDIFLWLLAQDAATVLQLLAFLVAHTVTGVCTVEPARHSNEALARALGLDMTKWWSATAASYFNHVPKARILEVVTEAVGANAASPLASLKKDAVVVGAEQTLTGKGWLPACMRISSADAPRIEEMSTSECPEAVLAA